MARRTTLREIVPGVPRRPPPGRPGDPGLFPSRSVARVINGETRLLLGGQRALLMQLAHPPVAAGVADHSDFLVDPFGRLWATLDRTLTVAFGDRERAIDAAARVATVHARVVGARGGDPYRALDPELLLWVHATLVDSALVTYERFVGRLAVRVRERYVLEMHAQAIAFGIPATMLWGSSQDFREYLGDTIEQLRVTDEARSLAEAVVRPTTSRALGLCFATMRLVTTGLLPARLRPAFGLAWSPTHERALSALSFAIRTTMPSLPARVRRWPHAREADARMRA